MRCKETITVLRFLYNISRIEHPYIAIHSQHNSREGALKLTDKIRSLKRKENQLTKVTSSWHSDW